MVVFNVEKFNAQGNYLSNRGNEIAKAFESDDTNKIIFFNAVSQEVNFSIQESALADFYTKTSFQEINTSYHTQISEKFTALLYAISDIFKGSTHFLQSLAYLPVNRAYSKVYLYTAVRDVQELLGNITMIFHHTRGKYWVDQANFHKAVYALYGTKIEIAEEALPVQSPPPPAEEAPSPILKVEGSLASAPSTDPQDGEGVEFTEREPESLGSRTPPPEERAVPKESAEQASWVGAPPSPCATPFKQSLRFNPFSALGSSHAFGSPYTEPSSSANNQNPEEVD